MWSCVDWMVISPCGCTTRFTDGDWMSGPPPCGGGAGTASITPPTRVNVSRYASHEGKRSLCAVSARFGSTRTNSSITLLTAAFCFPGSSQMCADRDFSRTSAAWHCRCDTSSHAWPLPRNSSSILNSHRWMSRRWKMRRASEWMVSCSEYRSYAPGGVFTSAIEKMRFEPLLDPYTAATWGSGPRRGMSSRHATFRSSGPTTPGMMYASLPRQKFWIRFRQRGEYARTVASEKWEGNRS
mmetsp:Transcript_47338/g.112692  ORF Transcript_47338/g.112692 Transcript_47338/m.112692 type:complete len:240 (-) Transcript_47338:1847-2566(-)